MAQSKSGRKPKSSRRPSQKLARASGKARRRSAKRPTKKASAPSKHRKASAAPPKRRAPAAPKKRNASAASKKARKPAARSRNASSPKNSTRKTAASRPTTTPFGRIPKAGAGTRTRAARLDRERRHLEEDVVQTPPSSLNMNRRGSAARTGRAELAESRQEHRGMTPAITGGDVDVDVENAYFSGDEAPGGDNPTPDQEVVDDIGKALGVEYEDNEELKASDKVTERDRHRWELDPASSEDYKDRK